MCSEWKNIESAPKAELGQIHGPDIWGIDDCGHQEKCWWEVSGNLAEWVTCGGCSFFPTHWLPLPSPPKELELYKKLKDKFESQGGKK